MTVTEDAIRTALEGHFYSMTFENGPKVVDAVSHVPVPRHTPKPWTDEDRAQLWLLKRRGLTLEQIAIAMERSPMSISQVWFYRRQWRTRVFKAVAAEDPVTLEVIRRACCEFYGIGKLIFTSSSRLKKACEARHVFCWMARKFTTKSTSQIGEYAGGKDHSTVLHAADKIESRFAEFQEQIDLICFDLGLEFSAKIAEAA